MQNWDPPRQGVALAMAGYSLLLLVVLVAPTSHNQSAAAAAFGDLLAWTGVPDTLVTQPRVEFVCNILILMPATALGAALWPRTTWRDWAAYTFALACAVELLQGVVLSGRTASFTDVVANTAGGLGGALLVHVVRRVRERSAP